MTNAPVVIQGLNYAYGEGALRRQVLFEIDAEIHPGEILILTGPSGSGKTTLLTLIGALRSVQEGSLKVLDRELAGLLRTYGRTHDRSNHHTPLIRPTQLVTTTSVTGPREQGGEAERGR